MGDLVRSGEASLKGAEAEASSCRPVRADALRNMDALLKAALCVFARSGVDAPVRQIAQQAGVGVGTVYRHFPQRCDLIVAVFRREVDECAEMAPVLACGHAPGEALSLWIRRYVDFLAAKRGLAAALHSGDPAYEPLPAYFQARLKPALGLLLDRAVAAGEARGDIDPGDLLYAVARLATPADEADAGSAQRVIGLLIDGLLRPAASPAA